MPLFCFPTDFPADAKWSKERSLQGKSARKQETSTHASQPRRQILEGDVKRSGKSWKEIKKIAQDRKEWKGFVGGLYPGPG